MEDSVCEAELVTVDDWVWVPEVVLDVAAVAEMVEVTVDVADVVAELLPEDVLVARFFFFFFLGGGQ